jgi:hypothetical protein
MPILFLSCSISVAYPLIELHVKLMRKLKKTVNFNRWEKSAINFAHSYSQQDGWELERFGYKKMGIDVKLRLLKVFNRKWSLPFQVLIVFI